MLGKLESIWRYPVKGMRGEEVDEIHVLSTGLIGDRVYAITTHKAPPLFPYHTARQQDDFLLYKARFKSRERTFGLESKNPLFDSETTEHDSNLAPDAFAVEVELPSGDTFDVQDPEFIQGLKEKCSAEMELRFGHGSNFDCYPVSLLSLQTVDQLRVETGFNVDKRQFRANFYVDWESESGFYEDKLVGQTIKIGPSLEVKIVERDARCKMITINPDTAEQNRQLLRHVNQVHQRCTGVYGLVQKQGVIRTGDRVQVSTDR